MILAVEGKLLIEFSIVQGKLGKQSHHSTTWISLHLNIESKQSIFNNRFQNANSCVFSEEVMKRSILIWRSKARKQPSDMRQHSHFSRKKRGLFGERATVYFYCLQSTTSSSPFSMSKIWFPVQLQCFRKTTAPPKTFYGCMRAANQAKRAKEKKRSTPLSEIVLTKW